MTDSSDVDNAGADAGGGASGDYEYDEVHGGGDEPTVPEHLGEELPPVKQPGE